MSKTVDAFQIFSRMMNANNRALGFYPLGNVTYMQKVKAGAKITFGVEEQTMSKLFHGQLVGGFVACDKAEYERVKAEMENEP